MLLTSVIIIGLTAVQQISDDPYSYILIGILIIIGGILLFKYRDTIGDFTGYYVGRGKLVDKPTPGCLLIPFAIAIIASGLIILAKSISVILKFP
jgi:hypothetical protein